MVPLIIDTEQLHVLMGIGWTSAMAMMKLEITLFRKMHYISVISRVGCLIAFLKERLSGTSTLGFFLRLTLGVLVGAFLFSTDA